MASTSAFCEYVVGDLLAGVDGVTQRRMFGGFGLYRHGVIFGFINNDELYMKESSRLKPLLEECGSTPFTYTGKRGKKISMKYWLVPAAVFEDRIALEDWVYRSLAE